MYYDMQASWILQSYALNWSQNLKVSDVTLPSLPGITLPFNTSRSYIQRDVIVTSSVGN